MFEFTKLPYGIFNTLPLGANKGSEEKLNVSLSHCEGITVLCSTVGKGIGRGLIPYSSLPIPSSLP